MIRLIDTYAQMLTAHQRSLLHHYYHDDFSLGEIASREGVTRQAVFDGLRRAVAELQHLEDRLRLVARLGRDARARQEAAARLQAVEAEVAHLRKAGRVDVRPLLRALAGLRETL